MILIFLREFAIVMTGFATVDFYRQPLLIKGVRFAQVIKQTVVSGQITPEFTQF